MITRLRKPTAPVLALSSFLRTQCLLPARLPLAPPLWGTRPFTSSTPHHSEPINHYAVLKVPPDCTHAELKKQFYVLSKETHPDINRHDPKAGTRFAQVSESYSILADPEKRKRYDRDFARSTHQKSAHRQHAGSYAGSRPASGLSKRRGAFRGPPPSFYKHGNPSANTARQAEASSAAGSRADGQGGMFNAGAFTDYGPDFDPNPTFRTQTHEDTRRQSRRAAAMAAAAAQADDADDFWVRFAVVSGVIVLGITVATMIGSMGAPRGGLLRGDGSKRSERRNDWTKG